MKLSILSEWRNLRNNCNNSIKHKDTELVVDEIWNESYKNQSENGQKALDWKRVVDEAIVTTRKAFEDMARQIALKDEKKTFL